MGARLYPGAARLLICANGGGSNGYRLRLWKVELQRLATTTGLEITACRRPPGTRKWNKIEHRLFSHITMNWRGHPLISLKALSRLAHLLSVRIASLGGSRAVVFASDWRLLAISASGNHGAVSS